MIAQLKEYIGMVVQEDGSELEETINEAVNLLKVRYTLDEFVPFPGGNMTLHSI